MRLLSSIFLFLTSLNLSAKDYSFNSPDFNVRLEIGTKDFIAEPFFNLDIISDSQVNITLPEDFKEKFYIENFEQRKSEEGFLYRYLLSLKDHEDFSLSEIVISKDKTKISFKDVEFKGLNKEVNAPTLNDIFVEEEDKGKYYLILVMTLLTSIVYWITKRKNNIKVFKANLNDLYEAKTTKDLCEKVFVHTSKFLRTKYHYSMAGKSAEEISEFLTKAKLNNLAAFIANSNEIMFAKDEVKAEESLVKTLKKELEEAWKNNEV